MRETWMILAADCLGMGEQWFDRSRANPASSRDRRLWRQLHVHDALQLLA